MYFSEIILIFLIAIELNRYYDRRPHKQTVDICVKFMTAIQSMYPNRQYRWYRTSQLKIIEEILFDFTLFLFSFSGLLTMIFLNQTLRVHGFE